MNLVLKDKVIGPSAWRGCDLVNDNSWVYQLSDDAIALINQALNSVKSCSFYLYVCLHRLHVYPHRLYVCLQRLYDSQHRLYVSTL